MERGNDDGGNGPGTLEGTKARQAPKVVKVTEGPSGTPKERKVTVSTWGKRIEPSLGLGGGPKGIIYRHETSQEEEDQPCDGKCGSPATLVYGIIGMRDPRDEHGKLAIERYVYLCQECVMKVVGG